MIGWSGTNLQLGTLYIQCNQGTPYTIEVDADVGGVVSLAGDTTGGNVVAHLYQGNSGFDTPFGSEANGEAITGIATGNTDLVDYQVAFNTEADGMTLLPVPAADVYRATINHNANF